MLVSCCGFAFRSGGDHKVAAVFSETVSLISGQNQSMWGGRKSGE